MNIQKPWHSASRVSLGIFAKTFSRPDLGSVFEAVKEHGFACCHFNFSCAGLPSFPDHLDATTAQGIGKTARTKGVQLAGVSATFNLIHPDPSKREESLERLIRLMPLYREIGSQVITLCTGTREASNMWKHHPDNLLPEAWKDLTTGLDKALAHASHHNLILGVEPETGNVMADARKARRLLDEIQSPHLKIVLDPANLVQKQTMNQQQSIILEAFDLLGHDLVMAHAKEVNQDGDTDDTLAIGQGFLDWECYLGQLLQPHFTGPLIIHGCQEDRVLESRRFLEEQLRIR